MRYAQDTQTIDFVHYTYIPALYTYYIPTLNTKMVTNHIT